MTAFGSGLDLSLGLPGPCPCGAGAYAACCQPLHEGAPAVTAEALMRSRYSSFALGLDAHLARTWHPRTRPATIGAAASGIRWTGLRILETEAGGATDATGVVAFAAHGVGPDGPLALRERSRFERRAGRWMYVDGDLDAV